MIVISHHADSGLDRRSHVSASQIYTRRESVLRQNLFTLRTLISQYTLDKQKAPQSLEDLVSAGYMKQIPNDPITGKPDWTVDQAQDTMIRPISRTKAESTTCTVRPLRSASNGTAYSTW